MKTKYIVGDVAVSQRKKLPHWDAECAIQFVTMHLAPGREFDHADAAIVADVVVAGDGKGSDLLAWCVMPDHLHVIMRPRSTMASIVRAWKSVSSRRLRGTWWQADYFDRLIRDTTELEATIEYVMNNPETAGLLNWDFRRMYPDRIAQCL